MQIKNITEKDIAKITELLLSMNEMHKENLPNDFRTAEEISKINNITKYINDEDRIGLGAYNLTDRGSEELIGCVLGTIWERKVIDLQDRRIATIIEIIVDGNYRGQDMGRQLYNAFAERAKTLKADEVSVEVYEFNQPAMKFYQSCGMQLFTHDYRRIL